MIKDLRSFREMPEVTQLPELGRGFSRIVKIEALDFFQS